MAWGLPAEILREKLWFEEVPSSGSGVREAVTGDWWKKEFTVDSFGKDEERPASEDGPYGSRSLKVGQYMVRKDVEAERR